MSGEPDDPILRQVVANGSSIRVTTCPTCHSDLDVVTHVTLPNPPTYLTAQAQIPYGRS